MLNLRMQRLSDAATLPTRATDGDAGLDLYADEHFSVSPYCVTRVSTGIAVEIPYGYVGLIHPRSGLAAKHGVTVVNAPGTIDAGYRGQLQVLLTVIGSPHGKRMTRLGNISFEAGARIAQLVIQKVELPMPIWVDELSESARGAGGFGSTGNR